MSDHYIRLDGKIWRKFNEWTLDGEILAWDYEPTDLPLETPVDEDYDKEKPE
jgi:hypothetical protein